LGQAEAGEGEGRAGGGDGGASSGVRFYSSEGKHGSWIQRIQTLAKAMGWSQLEAANKLGFKTSMALRRILIGGKPRVETLRLLRDLEKVYEREIQALRDALIQYTEDKEGNWDKNTRVDFRYRPHERKASGGVSARPEDLQALGEVAISGDGVPPAPYRVVQYFNPNRRIHPGYYSGHMGRSKDGDKGSGGIAGEEK